MDRERQNELLALARTSIKTAFTGDMPDIPETHEEFGSFVTLRKHGELRGCIGYMTPIYPLDEQVVWLARAAAFEDYRFPQLTEAELESCTIEISILSPPRLIPSIEDFILGTHGIILTVGSHRAVFLPQVADETGWGKEQLLGVLSRKAGLAPDAWKSPSAIFEVFTAEVFAE